MLLEHGKKLWPGARASGSAMGMYVVRSSKGVSRDAEFRMFTRWKVVECSPEKFHGFFCQDTAKSRVCYHASTNLAKQTEGMAEMVCHVDARLYSLIRGPFRSRGAFLERLAPPSNHFFRQVSPVWRDDASHEPSCTQPIQASRPPDQY